MQRKWRAYRKEEVKNFVYRGSKFKTRSLRHRRRCKLKRHSRTGLVEANLFKQKDLLRVRGDLRYAVGRGRLRWGGGGSMG